jgi:hypothetical protein
VSSSRQRLLEIGSLVLLISCGRPSQGEAPSDGRGDASLADGGQTSLADGGQTSFPDAGGTSLADGAPPSGPAGTLVLQIGGTEQAVTYDAVRVGGRAILGGQLVLQYAGGYVPPAGQKFVLIEADGGIAGTFATITSQGVEIQAGQDANTFWVTVQ